MMKKTTLLYMLLASAAMQAQTGRITVDTGTRGHDIPQSMYGIFFEEINHAGDGGLYAEMVQNRGFEEHVLPTGATYRDGKAWAPHLPSYTDLTYKDLSIDWDMEAKKYLGWKIAGRGCTFTKDVAAPETPLDAATPNALRLKIDKSRGGSVTVSNTGYWGMHFADGAAYRLRFYMKPSGYKGKLTVRLTDGDGNIYAEKDIKVDGKARWTEYAAELTAKGTTVAGELQLELTGSGSVDIDYVSLFPADTYKGRANGMRRDIAETLAALKPAFMRWPGGCIVEGWNLENRVRWKETLGDPMRRRGEYDTWGYRSTYGLGYHEFLQLCEDMNMDGMFVANVGMGCGFRNGDYVEATDTAGLMPYLQDIRDAIDYAIADPAVNAWAARRAEAGHPEPLPLKYVELGNENNTERYADRYAFFYNTLKAEYPQITFINTLSWTERDMIEKTDMYDVHWYVAPDFFYGAATLFEDAPRGDYKVYAGEYAANANVGSGNMDAALSEAAFMGAMERNSDFVTMTSYAPLLTNVNQPNWSCNLIWFDNHRVMGRASYYVQKMFAENRPDYNVKTRVVSDSQPLQTEGMIGLGTWDTQAEYRNIRVSGSDGKTLYTSDFTAAQSQWETYGDTWKVSADGAYCQTGGGEPCLSFMNAGRFSNYTVELEARKTGGREGFLVLLAADGGKTGSHYRLNIGGWNNSRTALETVSGGVWGTVCSESVPFSVETGRWYKIKVVMDEKQGISCYVDGQLLLTKTFGDIRPGRIQAFGGYDEKAGEVVVKVVNATESALTTEVCVNASGIQPRGKVITLVADRLTDENTLDRPEKISPVVTPFDGFADRFSYTFKPGSLTIFRIKADSKAANERSK